MNEDVFAVLPCVEEKALHPNIQELTEQIHRLLLQVGGPCALSISHRSVAHTPRL